MYALPSALASRTRFVRLGRARVPALLAHPDWASRVPVMVWMHGRTADKTLDNGRYLRWIRAGFAACALDLPGHGERVGDAGPAGDSGLQSPARIHDAIARMVDELNDVIEALRADQYAPHFDTTRLGLGGMSAGGVTTLRRLTIPGHPFIAGAIESAAGDLARLYTTPGWPRPDPAAIAHLDPLAHVGDFTPLPLLALHSESDRLVPIQCLRTFWTALEHHYRARAAPPEWLMLKTWPETGAPDEHSGFGRVAAEAKTVQTEFLTKWLVQSREA